MTENSKIEWTDHTFNPWIGCTKVSPGCDHCYAETMALRFKAAEWGAGKPRKLTSDSNWKEPLKWDKAARAAGRRDRVFCASLADVFDNEVDTLWRARLFDLIRSTPNLDWLLLTKRIGNVNNMLASWARIDEIWPNVWLGISVVNQVEADRDIPKLLATPARGRFLSIEPMLGAINLDSFWKGTCVQCGGAGETAGHYFSDDNSGSCDACGGKGVNEDNEGISWVIVGGESGREARPMHLDCARSLRDQCVASGVPFFFKQWGEWHPCELDDPADGLGIRIYPHDETIKLGDRKYTIKHDDNGEYFYAGKKLAGRLLDGREWNETPKFS